MKIVSSRQMSQIESMAYRDGSSEEDFMEEAGSGVALIVHDYAERNETDRVIILLCGKGNNGGDAYVAGIHLVHLEYEVYAVQVAPLAESTTLNRQNFDRFMHEGGRLAETLQEFPTSGVIVDGLFGTGFRGPVEEPYAAIIALANNADLPIISIDIPSGLNGETGKVDGEAIVATETAFLGLPKLGFFLNDGWNHVGKLRYIDYGLPKQYIEELQTNFLMLSHDLLKPLMPTMKRNRHKYEAGYVVGLAGSPTMPGAAMLSSLAALRGGAGIVKLLHPEGMEAQLATSPYELIRVPYRYDDVDSIVDLMNQAGATFIGPGMGQSPEAKKLLLSVLPRLQKPCVIDADALTIIAEENALIPKHAVLTPHHGEMARLLHKKEHVDLSMSSLEICKAFAETNEITLVLKGGPTAIFCPHEPYIFNPTGDPGMATAGSGDVLTGLIAALIAEGMQPKDAAALAVFIHGLAGEIACDDTTAYCMIASDIIFRFPEAFKILKAHVPVF